MTFVLERADGDKRVVGGYRFKEPAPDAKQFVHSASGIAQLPPKVDLRPFMTSVEDQRQTNSCSANATAGAYEYLMKRHLGEASYDVSRMFMYFNARAAAGEAITDDGAALSDVIQGLQQNGACSEETWPFAEENVNDEPDAQAFDEASEFLVEDVQQIPTELEAWKTSLAMGNPIIFGLKLFGSFDKQRKPGLVPAPSAAEAQRASHGGHAMLCVGYSDADNVFVVRNSWGAGWGDKGYCYIPYSYVMNDDYNFGDSWTIHRLAGMPDAEQGWGDDSSILEDVTTYLGELDDDAYTALLDAMGDYHLERRLALMFLRVVAADGNASDEELARAAEYLAPALRELGVRIDAGRLLQRTMRDANDDARFDESVQLLGENLPPEVLANIANQIGEAAMADGEAAPEEAELHAAIIAAWQLGTEEDGDGEAREGDA